MGILAAVMVPHPPLIIPEIGKGEESEIRDTIEAYHEAAHRIAAYQPETIVLLSPHHTMYSNYFHVSPGDGAQGDFLRFGARKVQFTVTYDNEFAFELCRLVDEREFPAGTMGEKEKKLDHGTMVPLYFINKYWSDYRLVRIGLSGLPLTMHYELGQYIRTVADTLGRKVVVVASGDLSHHLKKDGPYGFEKEGPEYDARIMDVMGRADFGELFLFSDEFMARAGECGHRSFTIMAGALDGKAVRAERLSYEGPFGVGYGICTYEVQGEDGRRKFRKQYETIQKEEANLRRAKEDEYVKLARRTIEAYVCTGKTPERPEGLPKEMYSHKAGVFVSIKKEGTLRGCIGTIAARRNCVAEEIMENAVSAAVRDPRFSPIRPEELEFLTISVDVLGETEEVQSPKELDVGRFGVIVTKGQKRGVLLPNLDGVDTVEEQIAIAKRKAGIREDDEVGLERFEVVRHY